MPLRSLSVSGYRSIRRAVVRLGQLNVIVGSNGCGKSNLYRSLYLLSVAAEGRLARTLADEGGMPSALWAGELRKGLSKRITIEVRFDEWAYRFACGLPPLGSSAFGLDPFVREERLCFLDRGRSTTVCSRKNDLASLRDDEGQSIAYPLSLAESESVMSELREPHRFPELSTLRSVIRSWRFYHQFRIDADSPLRRPQVGVRTFAMHHDGRDLAAALQTILELGDYSALEASVRSAFPGGRLAIEGSAGIMEVGLKMEGFLRSFRAAELSDGTLKYLCLLAALLSPRPPSLLAINEPDANLHPQLHEPLAELIATAARHSQLWITTHSVELAEMLERRAGALLIRLEKVDGQTIVAGSSADEEDEEPEDD